MTNAEIAEELGLSPKTVSAHLEHILAKLGAMRRAEVAAWVSTIRAPGARSGTDGRDVAPLTVRVARGNAASRPEEQEATRRDGGPAASAAAGQATSTVSS